MVGRNYIIAAAGKSDDKDGLTKGRQQLKGAIEDGNLKFRDLLGLCWGHIQQDSPPQNVTERASSPPAANPQL